MYILSCSCLFSVQILQKLCMNKGIPTHIGIIMDGNRRWAKERGKLAMQGHLQGYETLKKIANHAFGKGLAVLTVFAFSSENWLRSKTEVNFLLKLFWRMVTEELAEFQRMGVRVRFIGDLSRFPDELRKGMEHTMKETAGNTGGTLQIAASYGGREEIVRAVRAIVAAKTSPDAIDEDMIARHLYTADVSDPDLIIRTSGEERLSGFLPWQGVYSELLFLKKHWPAFTSRDFDAAVEEYASRQRRFGK